MRNIIFRGKIKSNNNWIYSTGYIKSEDKIYLMTSSAQILTGDWLRGEATLDESMGGLIEVIPETVGMSTGLIDKQGKEIYEGDIIKFDNYEVKGHKRHLVEYMAKVSYWELKSGFLAYINAETFFTSEVFYDCEVIGNIYKNPELIK